MKIIVGLGNPGEKYKSTRHNVGWMVLDWLMADLGFTNGKWQKKFASEILEVPHSASLPLFSKEGDGGSYFLFAKPQTFMNLSGQAVKTLTDFYKLNTQTDLLVIHDDIDLPLGKLKTTASASSAGHNGVADIIDHLGTQNFHRIRVGVETRQAKTDLPTEAFVLQNFTADEMQKLQADIFPQIKTEINQFFDFKNYKITKLQN